MKNLTRLARQWTMLFAALLGWLALSISDTVGQSISLQDSGLPNVDHRYDVSVRRTAMSVAAAPSDHTAAEQRLRLLVPTLRIERHTLLGSPHWLRADDAFLTAPRVSGTAGIQAAPSSDVRSIAKQFVTDHAGVFGHDASVLETAKVQREFVTGHSGLQTIVWAQEFEGIPVFESVFIAHATARGELVNISSQFLPDLAAAADAGSPRSRSNVVAPPVTATQAVVFASICVGESPELAATLIALDAPVGATQSQRFRGGALKGEAKAGLTWLPLDAAHLRLCWEVWLTGKARGELYRVLVDVETGTMWIREAHTSYAVNAKYRVFTAGSPTPHSPGYAAPGQTSQPLDVARSLVTLTAVSATASPDGWVTANETLGNNVDAHTDLDADDLADTPRPQGSPAGTFDFPIALLQPPSDYRKAAVVNLFYWCNWMHDKLYDLGFTEAAGNFQTDNFGRGGQDGDAVQADAQDGEGTDNANFKTPMDGSAPRMQMYLCTAPNPDRDGDFDDEVILHEYTHGLSNRRVGGGLLINAHQTACMGEGWSDFYALALLTPPGADPNSHYPFSAYTSKNMLFNRHTWAAGGDNYYFGCRRYPYSTDLSVNPLTFRDIDPAQANAHPGVPVSPLWVGMPAGEVHMAGEVWCVTLWETRAKLIQKYGYAVGNQRILQLVTDGMNLSPVNPTFLQARDAILQADLVLTGGADKKELWEAFAKRGMGASAVAAPNTTTTGLLESFDPPDILSVTPTSAVNVEGYYGGPFTPSLQVFTLTRQSGGNLNWSAGATAPLQLSATSGTLTVAQPTTSVTVSVGSGANALVVGPVLRSILFTNTATDVAQLRYFAINVKEPLAAKPPAVTTFSGFTGALPAPLSTTLVITNRGGAAIHWTAAPQLPLTVAPASGTLGAGQAITLTVSFDADTLDALPLGDTPLNLDVTDDTTGQTLASTFHIKLAEPLDISPHDGQMILGPVGGPFIPASQLFTLKNQGAMAIPWHVTAELPLVSTSASGTLAPAGGEKTIQVGINPSAVAALGVGVYTRHVRFTDELSGYVITNSFTLRIGKGDYHTEKFSAYGRPFDLGMTTLTFTPDGSQNYYTLCRAEAVDFPTDPSGGTEIPSYGDTITLGGGKTVALFGTKTNTVYVSRDGYVDGFNGPPGGDYWQSMRAQLFDGLPDPDIGTVTWKQLADRLVITWDNVMGYSADALNNFQAELFFNGIVRFTWLGTSDTPVSAIGLSRGTGEPADWVSSDLSTYPLCGEVPPAFDVPMTLTVSVDGREGGNGLYIGGVVQLDQPWPDDLVVNLTSSDTSEAVVPATVTIPAGKTKAGFVITVVDDAILDGSQVATLTATAAGHTKATDTIVVDDNETATLEVHLPRSAYENSVVAGVVTTDRPVQDDVSVWLKATAPDILKVNWPMTVIHSGATSGTFTVTALDDNLLGNPRSAGVIASVAGWTSGTDSVSIADNDPTNITVRLPNSAQEGDGLLVGQGEVSLAGFIASNLVVDLHSPDTTELTAPASVTILAGHSNAFFDIGIVDDAVVDGMRWGTVVAEAARFQAGTCSMRIYDNDGPPEVFDPQPSNLAEDVALQPVLSWGRVEGELVINGNFDAPGLTGWTREDIGAGGWIRNNGTVDPESSDGPMPPFSGIASALLRQSGNGRHALWQDITIPQELSAVVLSWTDRIRNHAADFATNQQFRVELRDPDNNQTLQVLFSTQSGETRFRNWTQRTVDLGAWRGQKVRLAFVGEDALGFLNVHLDEISILATSPVPTVFEVYLGTVDPPDTEQYLGSTSGTTWAVDGPLITNTTYYWQVVSKRGVYRTPGPVWQFNTGDDSVPPGLILSTPADFSIVSAPTNVVVTASVGGSTMRTLTPVGAVDFYADDVKIGQDNVAPFTFVWTNVPPGEHVLHAVGRGGVLNAFVLATTPDIHLSVAPPSGKMLYTLVPFGSSWSYNDTGVFPGASWCSPSFRGRLTGWKSGPAKLGYGKGDESTVVSYGDNALNKNITTYFRRTFPSPNVTLESLTLHVLRDDGVRVYLNGTEILRNNMPLGLITSTTTAVTNLNGFAAEHALATTTVALSNLVAQGNLIAAEVHQAAANSTDLGFDLELTGIGDALPSVTVTSPGDGTVFAAPSQLVLDASATEPYGAVTRIEMFIDGVSFGLVTGTMGPLLWHAPTPGIHTLRAVATDAAGHEVQSTPVVVAIVAPPVLALSREGVTLELYWPVTADGYHLRTTTNLLTPVTWESIDAGLIQTDGLWRAALSLTNTVRFFQLQSP